MSSEALKKPEKMKIAEKHLCKYLSEIKTHFGFSDFQIAKLLDNSSKKIKKKQKETLKINFLNFFKKIC